MLDVRYRMSEINTKKPRRKEFLRGFMFVRQTSVCRVDRQARACRTHHLGSGFPARHVFDLFSRQRVDPNA
jgi:hypothetical protein